MECKAALIIHFNTQCCFFFALPATQARAALCLLSSADERLFQQFMAKHGNRCDQNRLNNDCYNYRGENPPQVYSHIGYEIRKLTPEKCKGQPVIGETVPFFQESPTQYRNAIK